METMQARSGRLRYQAAPSAKHASRTRGRIQIGTKAVEDVVAEAAAHAKSQDAKDVTVRGRVLIEG
jgi:hypothetical protein